MGLYAIAMLGGIWIAEFSGPSALERCRAFVAPVGGYCTVWGAAVVEGHKP